MIDITKAQIIEYAGGLEATIYRDIDDTKVYYLRPEPSLVYDKGVPVFSLTRYLDNDGVVVGYCSFQVELVQNVEARRAAEQQLGPDITWGQYSWVDASVFLFYNILGESRAIEGTPSLYDTNRALFLIELKNQSELETFIKAFHATAPGLSGFTVEYNVTSLTKLLAAKATVKYNADIAISYEDQFKESKDIWGQTHRTKTGVRQNLVQSKAGSVVVTVDPKAGDELKNAVNEWAWETLEAEVAKALEQALALSGNKSPVKFLSSFERSYQENQIIEWNFRTDAPMPRFDDKTWQGVYTEVDTRHLVLTINLLGQLSSADDGAFPVDRVNVTIMYGEDIGLVTLIPEETESVIYERPGRLVDGKYSPNYKYQYQVFFAGDPNPYKSPEISTNRPTIDLLPADLGMRQATFIGTNIPFVGGDIASDGEVKVERLLIDFFFERPGDEPNKVEQQEMLVNDATGVTFSSFFRLPITNTYAYRLSYVMTDGRVLYVDPINNFGSSNRDTVRLTNPMERQMYDVFITNPTDGPKVDRLTLTTQYIDPRNSQSSRPNHRFSWQSGSTSPEAWGFDALPNPDGAYYESNGVIFFSNSQPFSVNGLRRQSKQSWVAIDATERLYSVQINTTNIEWDTVLQVEVTAFQRQAAPPPDLASRMEARRQLLLDPPDGQNFNEVGYTLQKPPYGDKEPNPDRFFLVYRPYASKQIEYFYKATYFHKDGPNTYVAEEEVTNQLSIILPPDGKAKEPTLNARSALAEEIDG